MLRWMLLGLLGLGPKAVGDERITILPRPESLAPRAGTFVLRSDTPIEIAGDAPEARWAGELLEQVLQKGLLRRAAGTGATIRIGGVGPAHLGAEGYQLTVAPNGIELRAAQPLGLLRGVQTLRQLLPPALEADATKVEQVEIPCVEISDRPRYRWRGMLLDCCRHFMEVEFVKRYVDLLAYHRMNVLHWHLTEDQGWRIQIDKYPRLAEVAAWRGDDKYGGYYSKDDIREVLAYAKRRGITVVPEIELPGHSSAALAAYPELGCTGGPYAVETRWGIFPDVYCAGNEATFTFLEDVLSEVIELFPSPYIHIGGDECPKTRWKTCPKCQARIKAEGLKDEHELQSYFIRRIERFLNSKGKRLIGWDEILEGGLAPNATVQSWRGMSGAITAAKAGHDVISSPTSHCYLDYAQRRGEGEPTFMGFIDLETAYSFEPTPDELSAEERKHVLGLEGNMWTEHAPQARVDYQVFPRLCALSEVAWSPKDARDWGDFSSRLQTHLERLDALGVTYYQPAPTVLDEDRVFTDVKQITITGGPANGKVVYTLDGTEPTSVSTVYTGPFSLDRSAELQIRSVRPNGAMTGISRYQYHRESPRPALPEAGTPGLAFRVYPGALRALPPEPPGPSSEAGVASQCDLKAVQAKVNYLLQLRGRLRVPTEGRYTFYLTSDDGSRLHLSGREVLDNDGLHGARTRMGQIMLQAGDHELGVDFFQAGGAQSLRLEWSGPGRDRQVVPVEALWHVEE